MLRLVLVVALTCTAAIVPQGAVASAGQGPETFAGTCQFDATDEFTQPVLPLQIVPGTLRGSGTCHGTLLDASGSRHQLTAAPAHLLAQRSGPGGCLGASNVGTGQLTLPNRRITFTLTETFVGTVGTEHLTGTAGGTGTVLLALVDRYDVVARRCVEGAPQRPHFVVHLTSPGISG